MNLTPAAIHEHAPQAALLHSRATASPEAAPSTGFVDLISLLLAFGGQDQIQVPALPESPAADGSETADAKPSKQASFHKLDSDAIARALIESMLTPAPVAMNVVAALQVQTPSAATAVQGASGGADGAAEKDVKAEDAKKGSRHLPRPDVAISMAGPDSAGLLAALTPELRLPVSISAASERTTTPVLTGGAGIAGGRDGITGISPNNAQNRELAFALRLSPRGLDAAQLQSNDGSSMERRTAPAVQPGLIRQPLPELAAGTLPAESRTNPPQAPKPAASVESAQASPEPAAKDSGDAQQPGAESHSQPRRPVPTADAFDTRTSDPTRTPAESAPASVLLQPRSPFTSGPGIGVEPVTQKSAAPNDVPVPLPRQATSEAVRESESAQPVLAPRISAANDIAVRIGGPDAPPVDVQMTERGGQIRVDVRTQDPGLQSALRHDLGTLLSSLDKSGFRGEAFVPAETARSSRLHTSSAESGNTTYDDQRNRNSNSDARQQRQRNRRQPPNEVETMENAA